MRVAEEQVLMGVTKEVEGWLDAPKQFIFRPDKVRMLKQLKFDLEEMLKEEYIDAEVITSMSLLENGDAVIEFECYDLTVRNMKKFYQIVSPLRNFEVYSGADEKIHFAGIFPDVADVFLL